MVLFDTMSVTNIKQEPLDNLQVDGKNDRYDDARGHVGVVNGDDSTKSINQDEMLQVMNIINRCEQESGSPESDDTTRADGEFAANGSAAEFKHECSICNARFKSARAFRGHGVIHRLGFDPVKRRISSSEPAHDSGHYCRKNGFDESPFTCDSCQAVFGSRDTYAMHMLMRAKDENCKARAQALGADINARSSSRQTSPGQLVKGVKMGEIVDGIYSLNEITKENNKLFPEYRGLIPDLITTSGDSREMLACHQCGEVFPSKDTLAMHAMFHTHDKVQQDKATRWAVIYSSQVTGLNRSPDSVVMHPVAGETLHQREALSNSSGRLDVDQESETDAFAMSPSVNQGLDLSISSPRSSTLHSSSNNSKKQAVSKDTDDVSTVGKQDGEVDVDLTPAIPNSLKVSNEVMNKLFCYTVKPPEMVSTQLRTVSADSGAAMLQAQEDLEVKQEPSIANRHCRPKSTDCSVGRVDKIHKVQEVQANTPLSADVEKGDLVGLRGVQQSYVINRIRQLRKSRFPMRKLPYGFRPLSRPWRQPEGKHVSESSEKSNLLNCTAGQDSSSSDLKQRIQKMLSLNGKDFSYCKYCEIVYLDRTLFQLHMGLHNVNNPWQCNACGKVCRNRLDFSSHVLHY